MDRSEDVPHREPFEALAAIMNALRDQNVDAAAEEFLALRLHHAEQALAHSEAWLRLATEAGGIGLVEWDITENRFRCNRVFSEIVNRDLGVQFDASNWLSQVHPDDRDAVNETLNNAIQHQDTCSFDCRIRGDHARWIEYHGRIVRNEEGTPLRVIGAVRDITARKEAELALESAKQKMEARIAERTRTLHRQTLQLRRLAALAMSSEHRERRRLAATLHDHLQQFLVATKMQLQFVHASANVDKLQQAVQRSVMLLEESIEITRGLSRELRPPVLYEDGFVPALRWLANEMREMHNLNVNLIAENECEPVGDDLKSLIFECVRELLFNVVKYAGVSDVVVEVNRPTTDSIRVAVIDHGAGFEASDAAPNAPAGVGTMIVRERLTSIGGGFQIESQPGHGTRAVLRAPIDLSDHCTDYPDQECLPFEFDAPDDRIRVVVVDDHRIVREGIASMVEGPTMTVIGQAADGLEAIDVVDQCRPQVVLMDLNMPRMNGIEATRAIRERFPDVAVIGLSVQDDEATASSLKDAGASAFVAKSHDVEELYEAILTVI